MRPWHILSFLLVTTQAFGNVTAYFNQNQRTSYVDPYNNISRRGDNLEAVLVREISTAKKSIYIAVYELRLPILAQALIKKKAEGVDVRVVLDNDNNSTVLDQREGSDQTEYEVSRHKDLIAFVDTNKDRKIQVSELEARDAIYMLRKANIPVMDDSFDLSRGSGLMHHKFVVIDGKTTIVSTANFTMSCVHGDVTSSSSRGNANSLVVVQSASFAKIFADEFSQLWGNGKKGNYGQNKTFRGAMSVTVGGMKLSVQFSPTSQRYNWEESTNGLIAAQLARATKSIDAALFVFSDQKLADVMEKRSSAGTRIGVLVEAKFAYRDYSEVLDLLGLEMKSSRCVYEPGNNPWKTPLRDVGVPRMTAGDVLHHKFGVIDNKVTVVGSQNWSDAANYINDETLVVIENTTISDQFTQEYNRIKQTASLGPTAALQDKIRRQDALCADQGIY